MQQKIAHLFPAFVLKYTGKEQKIIETYIPDFRQQINYAGDLLSLPLDSFNINSNDLTNKELENQLLSYIFSCAFSDILQQQNRIPGYISGFSMGLYAGLYHSRAIAYETGLFLIRDMFSAVKNIMGNKKTNMCSVIGFHYADLKQITKGYPTVEIVIKNGLFSFVIAGPKDQINQLFPKLESEGAIHLSKFNVSFPYHSKQLNENLEVFNPIANQYEFRNAQIPLISMVDQRSISGAEELRSEVVRNVTQTLDFYEAMQTLKNMGINEFVEVGADKALQKSSKFIEGDFKFYALSRGRYLP